MSLRDIVLGAIATANKVTRDLQPTVGFERRLGNDGFGSVTYTASVPLHAIVDFTSKQVRTPAGVLTVTRATISLLDIDEVVAATGGAGIGNDDRFTLPDGDTGPILDLGGFIDAGTGHPFATQVMLG